MQKLDNLQRMQKCIDLFKLTDKYKPILKEDKVTTLDKILQNKQDLLQQSIQIPHRRSQSLQLKKDFLSEQVIKTEKFLKYSNNFHKSINEIQETEKLNFYIENSTDQSKINQSDNSTIFKTWEHHQPFGLMHQSHYILPSITEDPLERMHTKNIDEILKQSQMKISKAIENNKNELMQINPQKMIKSRSLHKFTKQNPELLSPVKKNGRRNQSIDSKVFSQSTKVIEPQRSINDFLNSLPYINNSFISNKEPQLLKQPFQKENKFIKSRSLQTSFIPTFQYNNQVQQSQTFTRSQLLDKIQFQKVSTPLS